MEYNETKLYLETDTRREFLLSCERTGELRFGREGIFSNAKEINVMYPHNFVNGNCCGNETSRHSFLDKFEDVARQLLDEKTIYNYLFDMTDYINDVSGYHEFGQEPVNDILEKFAIKLAEDSFAPDEKVWITERYDVKRGNLLLIQTTQYDKDKEYHCPINITVFTLKLTKK